MADEIKEGTLRLMTLSEITMAKRLYGHSIAYNRVWIHCDSYFPFGLQSNGYAMTPNGELWYRKEMYKADFSLVDVEIIDKYIFIHELGHVWQHQHGQWVRLRGAFSFLANYYYTLDKEKLTDYSLEQQAPILADYWLLIYYGISEWSFQKNHGRIVRYQGKDNLRDIPALYHKIVTGKKL
ncbi:type IV secretion protein Rhs [Enterobacteriaceae bacterium ESL0689]|nr:type IV secretion protein Rhs [Enterobacteriaceae bacterium ESL0689]